MGTPPNPLQQLKGENLRPYSEAVLSPLFVGMEQRVVTKARPQVGSDGAGRLKEGLVWDG